MVRCMKPRTLALGLALPALGSAADADDPPRAIGPVAGITFSTEWKLPTSDAGDYGISSVAMVKPTIGLAGRFPMKGSWSFVPEIRYTQFGTRYGPFTISYHHLALPLIARAEFRSQEPITPHLIVGGELSFRLDIRGHSEFFFYGGYIAYYLANREGISAVPLDVGLVLGAGIEFPIENVDMHIDLRFTQGAIPHEIINEQLNLHRQVGVTGGLYFH